MNSSKRSTPEKASENESELSFEAAMQEIEKTVRSLEQGNLGLEQTLSEYEKAVNRIRFCHKQLVEAERKIEILRGVDRNGTPSTEPFSEDSMTLEQKQAARSKRRSSNSDLD